MVALEPHIKPIMHNTICNDDGHFIKLDFTILKHQFTFVNIYGPNIDEQASPFCEDLFSKI